MDYHLRTCTGKLAFGDDEAGGVEEDAGEPEAAAQAPESRWPDVPERGYYLSDLFGKAAYVADAELLDAGAGSSCARMHAPAFAGMHAGRLAFVWACRRVSGVGGRGRRWEDACVIGVPRFRTTASASVGVVLWSLV
eukprot:311805-Chlamydomonas_euryale.AAC.3